MTGGVALRLAVMAAAFAVMGPAQFLLAQVRPTYAGLLPMLFHRLFLRLFGIRVSAEGEPPAGAALILANHVSWLDIAIIGALTPVSFVAKSEVSGWPLIRTLARLQRTIFVDRARKTATGGVNAAITERLAAGDTIVLFAEGTTGDGLRALPFRSALLGALEKDAASPVRLQPLAIAYVRRNGLPVIRSDRPAIAWYGDMALAPHLAAFLRGGPVDVLVRWCEPIGSGAQDRKAAASAAEATVRTGLAGLRRRPPPRPVR